MEKEIIVRLHKDFEKSIYKDSEAGLEFWLARDLQNLLDYDEWRNFSKVIDKAKMACLNSGQNISDHFVDINKMVELGSGSQPEDVKKIERKLDCIGICILTGLQDKQDKFKKILSILLSCLNQPIK